jgi:hypothetical protein
LLEQVAPFWIPARDERFLFWAAPTFELFFTCYRVPWVWIGFEVNQLVRIVLPGKRASKSKRVFAATPLETVCDTDV